MAGGQSRRMGGGDKCLRPLAGRPILDHILKRVRPQVSALVLNANGDPARFGEFGLPVAADVVEGFAGPLAGVLTGLQWAAANAPDCRWLASFACDGYHCECYCVHQRQAEMLSSGIHRRSGSGGIYVGVAARAFLDSDFPRRRGRWRRRRVP